MSENQNLYKEEQRLLNELVKSEETSDKQYQNALKRTITRLNKDLAIIDES